jgi:lipopolysaccharide/colanic/teichoic acid biosynthesis glycosyltransferase
VVSNLKLADSEIDTDNAADNVDVLPELVVRNAGYLRLKVAIEWLVAFALFASTLPLLGLLMVVVKLTSTGPAFYAQTRLGRNGRHYRIIKLRTMVHGAEAGTGPVWAAKADSRITPFGKLLRITHLDELPQLWNVLRGDMALIGPRPERPEISGRIERHVPAFRLRLAVRPGITGLAQMLLPADDPADVAYEGLKKKLAHDIYYISNVGPMMDFRVALSTPCYFFAAAIKAVHGALVNSYGIKVEEAANDAAVATAPRREERHNRITSLPVDGEANGRTKSAWADGTRGVIGIAQGA